MTIRHHPSDETILAYANGSLAEALSLVVAIHTDGCGTCRETVGVAEAMGGALLADVPAVAMDADALARVLARLDTPVLQTQTAPPARQESDNTLPPALRRHAVGAKRWLAPGIWIRPVLKDRAHGTRLYLLGAAAGKKLPRHGHQGIELTQVLEGAFFDGEIRYGAGDFLQADGAHEHRPAVGDQDCVCVIASQGVPRGLAGFLMRAFT